MKKDNMQALFDTMDHEQNDFRNWLLQQPPEIILEHAYEYAVREDIIMAFSESDFELDQDQAGALLTQKRPLQTLLNDYTKLDSNVSNTLREVAEKRANTILQSYRETPVYLHTYGYAKSTGQESLYHTSHEANIKCRNAIEQAISDNYQDNRLHTEEAVKEVADIYGYDRPLYVLAVTVRPTFGTEGLAGKPRPGHRKPPLLRGDLMLSGNMSLRKLIRPWCKCSFHISGNVLEKKSLSR